MRSMPKPNAKPLHSSGSMPPARSTLGWTMPHPPSSSQSPFGRADVELRRRLGEREVARPQARREAGAEERLGERLDRAGQVGQRDVAVDDEPLDLVEHRHVRGVGRVAAEHPARGDDVDRRLGGRASCGSAPARCACAARVRARPAAPAWSTNSVSNSPRAGMPLAHVEGLEVVPVGLDLGALGDLEAEPDEHVLEPLPGLRDEVGVAAASGGRRTR